MLDFDPVTLPTHVITNARTSTTRTGVRTRGIAARGTWMPAIVIHVTRSWKAWTSQRLDRELVQDERAGMALSTDQRSLLYSVIDSVGANLMLVERFQ